jgi:flagellar biogenesis protein FliO
MDIQFIIMILLFIVAAIYVGRKFIHAITKHDEGGGSCSKCASNPENMTKHS